MIRMHQQCNPECLRKLSSRVLIHRQSYFACGGRKTHPHPLLREKQGVGEKRERESGEREKERKKKQKNETRVMPTKSVCGL